MRLLGGVRAALSWAVGGYLLAVAAFGPVLAGYLLTGGRTGLLVAVISGPVAILVLTPCASSRVLAALRAAGAIPDADTTRWAGTAFEQRGLTRPTGWQAPGLHGGAAVAVRGLRRFSVVLPPRPGGGSLDPAVATAVRRDLAGTSLVLPLHVATAAALSQWLGMLRLFLAPWTDRGMDGYYRARMFFLPVLTPIPALGVLAAWPAVLLSTLLVGPAAARDLVAAGGTARRGPTLDGRPVGLLRLPTAVAATQAGFSVPAFAAAGLVLGLLLWQPARLVEGVSDPRPPLVTTAFFLPLLLVVTLTLTRVVTGHTTLREREREIRAAASREAAGTPASLLERDGGRPRARDVLTMWPFWLLVLIASSGLAAVLALVVGLVGRLSERTDELRDVTFAIAFPVVLVIAVLWTLDAVLRRGDPLGLVRHSRSSRGLSQRW